jgi:hypothetical protein
MTTKTDALLKTWERRSAEAFPADAMLINMCIRELREAQGIDLAAVAELVEAARDVEGDSDHNGDFKDCAQCERIYRLQAALASLEVQP